MVVLVLIKVAAQSLKCLENLESVGRMCKAIMRNISYSLQPSPVSIPLLLLYMADTIMVSICQYLLFPTGTRCVIPPAVPTKGQRNVTGLTFGSTVIYSCKAGYTLNGSSTITCMANRQWSGKAPDCSRKLLIHQMYMCISYLGVHAVHQYIRMLLVPSEIFL